MVYVISSNGQPLMPTCRHGKVRRWLQSGQAKVVKRCPFTIQLQYEVADAKTQPVTLGVDAGSKHIGISATTDKRVLYESDVALRNDIVELLSTRREARKARRNRKTRYRKPRFLNRVHSKKKGWLAPSIEQKIGSHLAVIRKVMELLPVSEIVIETASFDTQMLKAKELGLPLPAGVDYQQGEQLYAWNVREYVLFRDEHKCRCCKGKSKDPILQVHHLQSRKVGGDAPNNLVTLCKSCHEGYHKGQTKLPDGIRRGNRYNDAAFMGIMRWAVYNRLKAQFPFVRMTFGYITKNTRIENNLPKTHYVDARCISGHPNAQSEGTVFFQKKVRCHNRQLHKFKISKGDKRQNNQAEYLVKGFRLFDKVRFDGKECFIFGRRSTGYFELRTLTKDSDNTKGQIVSHSANHKNIQLLEKSKHYLTERRKAVSSPCLKVVVSTADIR